MPSSYTSDQIRQRAERIIDETSAAVGCTGKLRQAVYEGNDGQVFGGLMTRYEMYLLDQELFGDEIADANYQARSVMAMEARTSRG